MKKQKKQSGSENRRCGEENKPDAKGKGPWAPINSGSKESKVDSKIWARDLMFK